MLCSLVTSNRQYIHPLSCTTHSGQPFRGTAPGARPHSDVTKLYSGSKHGYRNGEARDHGPCATQLTVAPFVPAWKAYDVPDVGNPRQVAQKTIESEAKPPVRHASVSSKIKIPLQGPVRCVGLTVRRVL